MSTVKAEYGTENSDSGVAPALDGALFVLPHARGDGQLTGVRVVDNLINVKAQPEHSDADVEGRVREAIAQTANLHARSIRVRMDNGVAQLSGQLPSLAALRVVLKAAEAAPGVTAVESAIVVASERAQPA